MKVRAQVNIGGIPAGREADVDGRLPWVRQALSAGFLTRLDAPPSRPAQAPPPQPDTGERGSGSGD